MNIDITGALFTLNLGLENSQCEEGASDVCIEGLPLNWLKHCSRC